MTLRPFRLRGAACEVSFRRYRRGRWSVVEATGELDCEVAPVLREFLEESTTSWIVIDLRRVTFMDCDVLGVLAWAWRKVRPDGGAVRLVAPTESVRELLESSLLGRALMSYPSVRQATSAPDPRHPVG